MFHYCSFASRPKTLVSLIKTILQASQRDWPYWLLCFAQKLDISGCTGLREFPPIEKGAFPELEGLDLSGCRFESLPASLCRLSNLVKLKLRHCEHLENLVCFCSAEKESRDPAEPCFRSLRELGLAGVDLKLLPGDLFEAYPTLTKISLLETADIPENLQILEAEGKLTIQRVYISESDFTP